MKLKRLRTLVENRCEYLSHDDALGGGRGDGGSIALKSEFNSYVMNLILKLDLRPSETAGLEDKEIGEPKEFKEVINAEKLRLIQRFTVEEIEDLFK